MKVENFENAQKMTETQADEIINAIGQLESTDGKCHIYYDIGSGLASDIARSLTGHSHGSNAWDDQDLRFVSVTDGESYSFDYDDISNYKDNFASHVANNASQVVLKEQGWFKTMYGHAKKAGIVDSEEQLELAIMNTSLIDFSVLARYDG